MNLQAMAASIAHETRQPLAAIVTSGGAALRFLDRTPPNLEEIRIALNRVINDGHRTSETLDGIRSSFSRDNQGQRTLNINDIVHATLENMRPEFDANDVEASAKLASELPPVVGNRGQLHEAILNLVHNAIDAMAMGTTEDRTLRVTTESTDRDLVSLTVEDSGPGIDSATLKRVFDPFVTTKPHGTGLGLAICRMIVEEHGGKISAANSTRGAVFKFTLPAAVSQDPSV